jgi:hypothetical protein
MVDGLEDDVVYGRKNVFACLVAVRYTWQYIAFCHLILFTTCMLQPIHQTDTTFHKCHIVTKLSADP